MHGSARHLEPGRLGCTEAHAVPERHPERVAGRGVDIRERATARPGVRGHDEHPARPGREQPRVCIERRHRGAARELAQLALRQLARARHRAAGGADGQLGRHSQAVLHQEAARWRDGVLPTGPRRALGAAIVAAPAGSSVCQQYVRTPGASRLLIRAASHAATLTRSLSLSLSLSCTFACMRP